MNWVFVYFLIGIIINEAVMIGLSKNPDKDMTPGSYIVVLLLWPIVAIVGTKIAMAKRRNRHD